MTSSSGKNKKVAHAAIAGRGRELINGQLILSHDFYAGVLEVFSSSNITITRSPHFSIIVFATSIMGASGRP